MSEQNYGMASGKSLGSFPPYRETATAYGTTFCKAYSFVIIDGGKILINLYFEW